MELASVVLLAIVALVFVVGFFSGPPKDSRTRSSVDLPVEAKSMLRPTELIAGAPKHFGAEEISAGDAASGNVHAFISKDAKSQI